MTREMKDSGIEWIGEIPERWSVVPAKCAFNEVQDVNKDGSVQKALKFKSGSIIPKTNFDSDDEYVAGTIANYTIVKEGDIIINGLNLNYDFKSLRVGLVQENGVITSAYLALRPQMQRITSAFATYLLKGYETRMALHNMGYGIRKTLGFKEFKTQPILLPSLPEQSRIADFLDTQCSHIDDVISKTKSSIEEYKKLKQAVITEAVTKGIRPGRKMKDSGIEWIGEIPEEWEIQKIKYQIDFIESGVSVNAGQSEAKDGQYGVLKTSSVSKQVFDVHENKNVNQEEIGRLECPVKANTIIVSRMNTPDLVGACGYVDKDYDNIFLPDRLWQVHFQEKSCVKFVYYWLRSTNVRNYYSSLAVGTSSSMQNISQDQFYHIFCPTFDNGEQHEIADYLDSKCSSIDALISKKEQFITELTAYKKSLIYEYVTGKKEVPAKYI